MANTQPIPEAVKKETAGDNFMNSCIYETKGAPNKNCYGRIEWEHAFLYAGKRINERWNLLPCCTSHNRGDGIVKDYNHYRALLRAEELLPDGIQTLVKRYPRFDWIQNFKYLRKKYEKYEK